MNLAEIRLRTICAIAFVVEQASYATTREDKLRNNIGNLPKLPPHEGIGISFEGGGFIQTIAQDVLDGHSEMQQATVLYNSLSWLLEVFFDYPQIFFPESIPQKKEDLRLLQGALVEQYGVEIVETRYCTIERVGTGRQGSLLFKFLGRAV